MKQEISLRNSLNAFPLALIHFPNNVVPQVQPENPLLQTAKANSSNTESSSLSETYNYQSHNSSPVDSFFDGVSSPEFSNISAVDSANKGYVNQPLVQDFNCSLTPALVSSAMPKIDPVDALIDELVRGKPLPQKGNLLQSVTDAGPLLQNLLVAGPLPQWRNPPPLQSFDVLPLAIKGCENASTDQGPVPLAIKGYGTASINQRHVSNTSYSLTKPLNSIPHPRMPGSTYQTCSASVLNFTNAPSGTCLNNVTPMPSSVSANNNVPAGKRRKAC
ncbi:TOX high mobility group box family member 4-A, putative isoform 4 [Quillaja saponaria]|uniref:TOX high mobility group box family member 4-A, putative isoform 4 n=1 Tax=Quillaja saponaria TaxID=32244 RepID=A0AAD7VMI7_QUISA|nr:TOX high mobility group box family member 4-A, putative isoform 4 [Quillaja saponaria]